MAENTNSEKDAANGWLTGGKQLLPLLALVLGIKFFVADIYGIPSGSMEPTLHGREHSGDRIFCSKINYYFRTPQRWEVFVFKFPYEESRDYTADDTSIYKGEYFIKRCVGLPNEEIFIARGDIWTRKNFTELPTRQVKDDQLQREIWLPVYHEDFVDLRSAAELGVYWENNSSIALRLEKSRLIIPAAAEFSFRPQVRSGELPGIPDRYVRRQFVVYRCPQCGKEKRATAFTPQFTDRCASCQYYLTENDVAYYDFRIDYPPSQLAKIRTAATIAEPIPRADNWHFVPDLRFVAKYLFPQADSELTITLNDDKNSARLLLSPAAKTARLLYNDIEIAAAPLALSIRQLSTIEFYRCDGEYRAFINDEKLFAIAVERQTLDLNAPTETRNSGVGFSVKNGGEIHNLQLDRDIYYYNASPLRNSYRLAAKQFFALGDNCPSSNDSRNWGPVPQKNLVGPALVVWWPPSVARVIH